MRFQNHEKKRREASIVCIRTHECALWRLFLLPRDRASLKSVLVSEQVDSNGAVLWKKQNHIPANMLRADATAPLQPPIPWLRARQCAGCGRRMPTPCCVVPKEMEETREEKKQ